MMERGYRWVGWALLLGLAVLTGESFLLGPASPVIVGDNAEIVMPGLMTIPFAGNPAWDVFGAAGSDRMSFGFLGLIDVFLFQHVAPWWALTLRTISVTIVAGLSAYALGRRGLGLTPPAALFAALAVGATHQLYFAAHAPGYALAVVATLAWVLDDKRELRRWLALAAALILATQAVFISRLVPAASAIIFFWFLCVDIRKRWQDWLVIVGVCLAIPLLRLPDFAAMSSQVALSHVPWQRGQLTLGHVLAGWPSLHVFAVSKVHAACAGLFLIGAALTRPWTLRVWLMAALVLFGPALLIVVPIALQEWLGGWVPAVRGYSVVYSAQAPNFIALMAGGWGLQQLLAWGRASRLRSWGARVAIGAAVVVIGMHAAQQKWAALYTWVTHGSYVRNFESPAYRRLAALVQSEAWPWRAEPFQMFPAMLHPYGIETAGGYVPFFPRRYYEYWSVMLEPWLATQPPTDVSDADLAMYPGEWHPFRSARLALFPTEYRPQWNLDDLYRVNMLSLANVRYMVSRDRLGHQDFEQVEAAPAPWSSLSAEERTAINLKWNFEGRDGLYLYRNTAALPRFFSVERVAVKRDSRQTLQAIAMTKAAELGRVAFVAAVDLPADVSPERAYAPLTITLESYAAEEIRLVVSGRDDGVLVVTNAFSPFWVCEIDGNPATLFPAHHAFWGVKVPAGDHRVTFRYQPPYRR